MGEEIEDNGKNTAYFRIKRTQPFFITFVQAIIAFKRVARAMKIVFSRRQMKKEKTQKNTMKEIIQRSTQAVLNSLHGQPVIKLTKEEMANYRYLAKLKKKVIARTETAGASMMSPDGRGSSPTLDGNTRKLPLNMAEKLRKRLYTGATASMIETLKEKDRDHVVQEPLTQSVATGIHQLMNKNANFTQNENKQAREYVPGTAIYYGSTIAVQARHGGYLSYNDAKNIKASAHKIMSHSRFIVTKADDATYVGTLKYGDAIMLQVGQHEVLGAQFLGGPDIGESRTIKPALINFRRENAAKAASVSVFFYTAITNVFIYIFMYVNSMVGGS